MADETAEPVVSNEPVATPVGDTEGTAAAVEVEQPQQQTAGADAADESPAVELNEEQRKSWNDLPPPIRKQVNRLFTQKSQELAAEKQKYGSYAQLAQALEMDPDNTVELLARHRGFKVERAQPTPTAPEKVVTDDVRAELEAQFGPDAAGALLKAAERIADRKAEERVKPYADFHAQSIETQQRADATAAEQALAKEFPDYEKFIPQMTQIAQKLTPGPGMTKAEYARILYLAANPNPNRTSAQQTNAVIQNLTKAAKTAEAPSQAVPTQRVAKTRPQGLSFDQSMKLAAEAAARGEVWSD